MLQEIIVYSIGVVIGVYLILVIVQKIRLFRKSKHPDPCSGCNLKDCCSADKKRDNCQSENRK